MVLYVRYPKNLLSNVCLQQCANIGESAWQFIPVKKKASRSPKNLAVERIAEKISVTVENGSFCKTPIRGTLQMATSTAPHNKMSTRLIKKKD